MAKKFFLIMTMFYCLCIGIYLFKFSIANLLTGHDPEIINWRSLTYLEHKNSIKSEELSKDISVYFFYTSIIISIIFGFFWYLKLIKDVKVLKIVFYVSLFWSVFLLLAHGIGFIGRGYIT